MAINLFYQVAPMSSKLTGRQRQNNKVGNGLRISDVSSNHLNLLAWVLERQGKDPRTILAKLGITTPSRNDPVDRVPVITIIQALEEIQRGSDDPCAALKLYGHMKLSHLNVLGFALSCSSNLQDFLERACRFTQYVSSAFAFDYQEFDDHYRISGGWNPTVYEEQLKNVPNAQLLLECGGYSALSMMREAYGESLPILRLYLPGHPHPKVVAAFEEATQCPVETGGDYLSAIFSKDVFTKRLPGANPQLARVNDQQIVEYLAEIEQSDLVHRCERLIIEGIANGTEYKLTDVAKKLGTSERSLKKNLSDHKQNFSDIVARIKKTLAIQHLQENKKNISQIAYSLGFDGPSNFSRAFRRWTGVSPRDYKRDC
ncbi:helix-turn-helix domain-containing protein [Zhongshania arctica]|uniref:Helix-turn-helix domain-containing protein n=1 Tax=Zhongshania arctica TaxID=3238302 RepID=A0ABV3TRK5_9GAMM|tara:strand:- start:13086 stop:14201 length:1116 start_codon:yes stop_codon:yes gene_type:complete